MTDPVEFAPGTEFCAVTTGECLDCGVDLEVIGHFLSSPETVRAREDLPCVLCGRPVATVAVIRPHSECS